jgi:hypothetical protein
MTAGWLRDCLAAYGFADPGVEAIRSEPIGTGQAAGCARIHIRYAGAAKGAPQTLVAKFPSPDALSRATSVAMGLHRREVEFYRDVAPRLGIRTPRCYFLDVDPAGDDFLMAVAQSG